MASTTRLGNRHHTRARSARSRHIAPTRGPVGAHVPRRPCRLWPSPILIKKEPNRRCYRCGLLLSWSSSMPP
ncbi:hypothetical protein [Pandoravirus japonicus]|uniref:Uncharacterized protein n=1 Tax=Pandoravirus japonicus TaxID=2823154 RepID=A0A811BRD4_9VIRU|nr:hypothetical protein [Pandoravirus japonicus]